LLDLLADEVARRLERRSPPVPSGLEVVPSAPLPVPVSRAEPEEEAAPAAEAVPEVEATPTAEPEPEEQAASVVEAVVEVEAPPTAEWVADGAAPSGSHVDSVMTRLGIGIFVAVLLINIPLNTQGMALARSVPTSASLVIRNGLLVKAATSSQIWVYRDGAFHWITSMTAFERLGYRWQNVHVVEPEFLDQFPKGRPYYLLLKCSSPQIYRLDEAGKHWVADMSAFEAEGYDWRDVQTVPCPELRGLPDGDSIPPGRGSPPPPGP